MLGYALTLMVVCGLLGVGSEIGILPARYAIRPAWTPSLNAVPINAGSSALAIAVFTRTASAPISMTIDASEGTPSPASTTTGTSDCSMMIAISSAVSTPLPDPIGEPSGMTVAHPMSCSLAARTGSAWMYGRTVKPSAMSVLAAA